MFKYTLKIKKKKKKICLENLCIFFIRYLFDVPNVKFLALCTLYKYYKTFFLSCDLICLRVSCNKNIYIFYKMT